LIGFNMYKCYCCKAPPYKKGKALITWLVLNTDPPCVTLLSPNRPN